MLEGSRLKEQYRLLNHGILIYSLDWKTAIIARRVQQNALLGAGLGGVIGAIIPFLPQVSQKIFRASRSALEEARYKKYCIKFWWGKSWKI